MGKQSRKKNRQKGKKKAALGKNDSTEASENIKSDGPNSSMISRLRHGDARLRHGSLAALSSTLFSPESLSSRKNQKGKKSGRITLDLLQVLAERIMDNDMPCAMCASGCISNYVLFSAQEEETGKSTGSLLSPILLGRINNSCETILKLGDDLMKKIEELRSTNDNSLETGGVEAMDDGKKTKKTNAKLAKPTTDKILLNIMDHWYLISLCLHALCGLVEGSVASNQNVLISLLSEPQGNTNFLMSLLKVLYMGGEMLINKNSLPITEDNKKTLSDALIHSSRTLHAAVDENKVIVTSILEMTVSFKGDMNLTEFLISCMENNNMPALCRLHCAGILVTVRNMLPNIVNKQPVETTISKMDQSIILPKVLPTINIYMDYRAEIASALWNRLSEAREKMDAQKQDENIEKEIINKVDKKKESARSIARRQKAMKEAATNASSEQTNEKSSDSKNESETTSSSTPQSYDATDHFEKAQDAWSNACMPLKLAIEVVTNLCAGSSGSNKHGLQSYNDDEDEMWDDIMEAKFAASQGALSEIGSDEIQSWDIDLFSNLQSQGIPDKILALFGAIILSGIQCGKDNICQIATDDLMEILSKIGSCLCNVVLNIPSWKEVGDDAFSVWSEMCATMQNTVVKGQSDHSVTTLIPLEGIAAVTHVMKSFTRQRPALLEKIGEQELTFVLSLVRLDKPDNGKNEIESNDIESLVDIQQDSVTMVGMFSSQSHSDTVNAAICDALLTTLCRLSTRAPVMSEILNVFMDIFGAYEDNDPNAHTNVFVEKNILNHFQKSTAILKKKIRQEQIQNNYLEEAEIWKETVLNATRFVKYKKGQL